MTEPSIWQKIIWTVISYLPLILAAAWIIFNIRNLRVKNTLIITILLVIFGLVAIFYGRLVYSSKMFSLACQPPHCFEDVISNKGTAQYIVGIIGYILNIIVFLYGLFYRSYIQAPEN